MLYCTPYCTMYDQCNELFVGDKQIEMALLYCREGRFSTCLPVQNERKCKRNDCDPFSHKIRIGIRHSVPIESRGLGEPNTFIHKYPTSAITYRLNSNKNQKYLRAMNKMRIHKSRQQHTVAFEWRLCDRIAHAHKYAEQMCGHRQRLDFMKSIRCDAEINA